MEASNTQQTTGPVEDMMEERKSNRDGWDSKRGAGNNQHVLGAIDRTEIIPSGWNSQGRQAILNKVLVLFKVPWRRKTSLLVDGTGIDWHN